MLKPRDLKTKLKINYNEILATNRKQLQLNLTSEFPYLPPLEEPVKIGEINAQTRRNCRDIKESNGKMSAYVLCTQLNKKKMMKIKL